MLLFFLIIHLYFLNPEVIAKILNPISELMNPIGIPSKEPKAETISISEYIALFLEGNNFLLYLYFLI